MPIVDTLIDTEVDGYVVLRHLKRGGMADVYLARHKGLQRDVAMKVLLASYLDNEPFVERFQREAQAMARIEHPNIVHVYDTGTLPDERPYFTMQYVPGGTLEEKLTALSGEQKLMTIPYALATARQVAAALQVAHGAGLIHRDLKPSNILLDAQGRPVLTDLGIAFSQADPRLTRTDVFLGTPHYMSPEQAQGLPLDARSDIYSLGVVLYEMLAGQRPFNADSHWALINQHVTEPPPPLATLRPALSVAGQQVVARCLEKDPARRYQSAAELVIALDGALRAEGAGDVLTSSGEWQTMLIATSELAGKSRGTEVLRPGQETATGPAPAAAGAVAVPAPAKRSISPGLIGGLLGLALLIAGGAFAFSQWGSRPAEVAPEPTPMIVTVVVSGVPPTAAPTEPPAAGAANALAAAGATIEPSPTRARPSSTPAAATATPDEPTATVAAPAAAGQEVTARVTSNVFTRQGPGTQYPIFGSLAADTVVEVIARDRSSNWYLVRLEGRDETWISAQYLSAEAAGSLEAVEVAATIPAPPTPTPTLPPSLPGATATSTPDGGGGAPPRPADTPAPPTPIPTPCEYPFTDC